MIFCPISDCFTSCWFDLVYAVALKRIGNHCRRGVDGGRGRGGCQVISGRPVPHSAQRFNRIFERSVSNVVTYWLLESLIPDFNDKNFCMLAVCGCCEDVVTMGSMEIFWFRKPNWACLYLSWNTNWVYPTEYRLCISRMLGNGKKTLPIHKWVYNKLKSTTWCIQLEYPSDTSKRKLHSRYRGSQVSWLPWSLVGLDRKWIVIRRFFVIYRNYPDLFQAYPPSSNTTWPSPSNHTMGLRTLPTDHIQTGHIEALSNDPFMRGLSRWWNMGDVSWL